MKKEPTDLDREAAGLFTPAPGMRALMADAGFCGEWVIVCDVEPGLWAGERGKVCGWRRGSSTRLGDAWEAFGPCAEVLALDTDDPATVGAMLPQIHEHAALWYWPPTDWRPVGAWAVVGPPDDSGCWCRGFDPVLVQHGTRGAALVSAKRAVDKNRPVGVPMVSDPDTQRRKTAPQ